MARLSGMTDDDLPATLEGSAFPPFSFKFTVKSAVKGETGEARRKLAAQKKVPFWEPRADSGASG